MLLHHMKGKMGFQSRHNLSCVLSREDNIGVNKVTEKLFQINSFSKKSIIRCSSRSVRKEILKSAANQVQRARIA